MKIELINSNDELSIKLNGRLDTITSPELEEKIKENIKNKKKLVFDFEELDYVSSAGLRLLLSTQKIMNKQGEMVIINVNDNIKEVFEITGFDGILTVE